MKLRWMGILLATSLLLSACSTTTPPEVQDEQPGIITLHADCLVDNTTVPAPLLEEGTLSDGSLYEIYKPENWNGRLMMFAHGYFDPYANSTGFDKANDYKNLFLPNHYSGGLGAVYNEVVCNLVLNGFALAWSSYNINGYAVESGYKSTQELRNKAADLLKPNRVYVMGFSLGGQVAITLMEKYPASYDGALPACGPVAGSSKQLSYVGDVRAVFDYGFPKVLPGAYPYPAITVPEPPPAWSTEPMSDVVQGISNAVNANLASAQKLASLSQLKLPYTNDAELVTSWTEALYFAVRGVNNAIHLANGNPYDNRTTSYSGLGRADDKKLNQGIIRYTASSAALNYFKANYDTTGNLNKPVLTLHTNRDPQIPFSHEADYGAKVSAQRKSSNLAQQYVDRYGHCNFKAEEVANALNSLITWVESPSWLRWLLKPTNGDVTVK